MLRDFVSRVKSMSHAAVISKPRHPFDQTADARNRLAISAEEKRVDSSSALDKQPNRAVGVGHDGSHSVTL